MNAKCPACHETHPAEQAGDALPYMAEHERREGVKCYGSGKPVERSAVSGAAAKKTANAPAKKAPAKRAAKKTAKS